MRPRRSGADGGAARGKGLRDHRRRQRDRGGHSAAVRRGGRDGGRSGPQSRRRGVRVNALCPGPVNTPLLQELFAKDPGKAARRLVHLPMGRFAEAREIANGALFLASDDSSYVTASTFLVDGGLSAAYVTPE